MPMCNRWFIFTAFVAIIVAILLIIAAYSSAQRRATIVKLQLVIIAESLLFLGANFVWKQLVDVLDPTKSKSNGSICDFIFLLWRAVVFLFLVLAQCSIILGEFIIGNEPYWLVFLSYVCLGTFVILISVLMPVLTIEFCINGVLGSGRPLRQVNQFMKVTGVILITILLTYSGVETAAEGPWQKEVDIHVNKLPQSMDGFKVAQLSDIHLGPTVGQSQLRKAVDIANDFNPDLVVITGDLVDSNVDSLKTVIEPIKYLKSKHGIYFVTGNHEYHTGDVDNWFVHLKSLGISPLHNDRVEIHNQDNPDDWFYLAGIDDKFANDIKYTGHGMDLDKTLENTDYNHAIILLAHQPKAAYTALESQYDVSLVLSGHTHAGHILPFMLGVYLMNPYFAGLYQHSDNSYVYVSSGTYYWGMPMRLASTPEVTYITLKAA
ncbi:transmembrane protein with metallophosphoesterase domain-like [Saccoglossus kowalevskii]|uniref:Transmembrane protein with metallophosphoesterase domain-like n=1 Tax=Saccoglossus kowalevskii TaxID=10224 RepID=A0ABM0GS73_SACKO|nr:PREDICTED: transmembrane protein with metallophosphoesterase domain-like [Saccoglossus kowalevskii]